MQRSPAIKGNPLWVLILTVCSLPAAAQVKSTTDTLKRNKVPVLLKAGASPFSIKPVALNTVYYNHLGFMCRQELKLEKATKTSFRFRLGSVEYTDRMEGKGKPVTLR
ncbi:hypothetical protein [Niabella drilacis]|uniref:Uncharacterized protein n=1 Tax=Niabella drilacis (strain DSM 25811 / CCM 8410 / CCUG 62505 / LMG 26954 / E90) TaxID=1285928 RepID=A0A1G6PES1_NIADE|nr:hypothetical protein [Niabella drilacis]SDC78528.1 hypothetical protein SAMN04487894_10410 [Niabella drilacis]